MMPIWNQYSSDTMMPAPVLSNNTQSISASAMAFKEEYQENELILPNIKKFQSESYQDNSTKVRTSIGSCGEDDSGVVNSISTDGTGSLSNTPPTVYQSPDRVNSSNIYQNVGFPNSYYYKQNYAPYPMMPSLINANNENSYQTCYAQTSLNNFPTNFPNTSQHNFNPTHANMYAKEFYNTNFMAPQPTPNMGYYNNVNLCYGGNEGHKYMMEDTKSKAISQQKTSSPIQTSVLPKTEAIANSQSEINLSNITNQNINNPKIKIKLQDQSLWKSFHEIGTEMIITKTGRYAI